MFKILKNRKILYLVMETREYTLNVWGKVKIVGSTNKSNNVVFKLLVSFTDNRLFEPFLIFHSKDKILYTASNLPYNVTRLKTGKLVKHIRIPIVP